MQQEDYNYEKLIVWQRAIELVEEVYAITRKFPRDELYALTSQVRRAAFSIPFNIAEGQSRRSKKEFLQFLFIARGSAYELNTGLLIALRLQYIDQDIYGRLTGRNKDVIRLLNGLINSLQK